MTDKSSTKTPLPQAETLVLDIVEYLLTKEGYGYSTQISTHMIELKPRRYTSREVVGILRNRPMFRHAQSRERKGGIRWRLDLLSLERYLEQKGYQERAQSRDIFEGIKNLKMRQLMATIESLESMDADDINTVYQNIATLWS